MSWVYLDDRFPLHPKVVRAGPMPAWLYVCGLAYSNCYGTQGRVPKESLGSVAPNVPTVRKHAGKLVEVGLWHDDGDAYTIHDYDDYNRSAQARKEKATKAAEARWGRRGSDAPSIPNAPPEHSSEADVEQSASMEGAMLEGSDVAMPHDALSPPHPLYPSQSSSSESDLQPPPQPSAEEEDRILIDTTCRLLAERRLQLRGADQAPVTNPAAYLRSVATSVRAEVLAAMSRWPQVDSAEELADLVQPPPAERPAAKPDPLEATVAAQTAMAERNRARQAELADEPVLPVDEVRDRLGELRSMIGRPAS